MKDSLKKLLGLVLCAALLVGGVGTTVYAKNAARPAEDAAAAVETAASASAGSAEAEGLFKEESVYVLAGADGAVDKIIVSDWLKNPAGEDSIQDASTLTDIENVKGDEGYSFREDGALVWDAKGNDIYYQGSTDAALPVQMTVSYTLDGKAISPEELAGKSGHVCIRFDYENALEKTVEVDGKEETMYVPFAMLTGLMLDDSSFRNVEVSNGKIINDGSRIVVAGLAFPGLQESLNIDREALELPDYVEIRADVENFSLENTVTVATSEIFSQLEGDEFKDAADLGEALDQLTDGMRQLMDGSSALYDGLCTLLEKSGQLVSGIDQLAAGAAQLQSGAGQLQEGAGSLAAGLSTLDANSAALNTGASQIASAVLAQADESLAASGLSVPKLTLSNYADVLNGLISSMDPENVAAQVRAAAREQVAQAVETQRAQVTAAVTAAVQPQVQAQVTAAVRENVESQVLSAMGMTREDYQAGIAAGQIPEAQQAQVTAAVEAQMQSAAVQNTIAERTAAQMQSDAVQATIKEKTDEQVETLIDQQMNTPDVQAKITAALAQMDYGDAAAKLSALKGQLDSVASFCAGLGQYTSGVASAKSGALQLQEGAGSLAAGAGSLYDGILTLKNNAPALVEGVTQLRDGSMQLSQGLSQFNDQGVSRLTAAAKGGLGDLLARLEALRDLAKDYKSYSGLAAGMDGQVKFIYRTEAIELD